MLWTAALAYVWMRFTAGFEVAGQSLGMRVVEQDAREVLETYIGLLLLAAVVQLGVSGYLRTRGEDAEFSDERDQSIEIRANQVGYYTGIVILNLIIGHVIATDLYADGREQLLDFASPTGLVFALLTALLLQEIVKNATRLVLHRTA